MLAEVPEEEVAPDGEGVPEEEGLEEEAFRLSLM